MARIIVFLLAVVALAFAKALQQQDEQVQYRLPWRRPASHDPKKHVRTTANLIATVKRSKKMIADMVHHRKELAEAAGKVVAHAWFNKHTRDLTTEEEDPTPAPAPLTEAEKEEKIIEDGGSDDVARADGTEASDPSSEPPAEAPPSSSTERVPNRTIKTDAAELAKLKAEEKAKMLKEMPGNYLHDKMDARAKKQFKRSPLARGAALSSKCNSRCAAKSGCNVRCQLSRDRYQLAVAKATFKKDYVNPVKYVNNNSTHKSWAKNPSQNQRFYSGEAAIGACNRRCEDAKKNYQKARLMYMKTFHTKCQNGHIKNTDTLNGKPLSDQGNPSGDTPGDITTKGGYAGVGAGRPLGKAGAGQVNFPNFQKYNWKDCPSYENQAQKSSASNPVTHDPDRQKSWSSANKEEQAEAAKEAEAKAKEMRERQEQIIASSSGASASSSSSSSSSSSGDTSGDTSGDSSGDSSGDTSGDSSGDTSSGDTPATDDANKDATKTTKASSSKSSRRGLSSFLRGNA